MVRHLGVFVAAGLLAVATPAAADIITAADVVHVDFQTFAAYPSSVNELSFGVGFMTFLEQSLRIESTLFLDGAFKRTSFINTSVFGTGLVHFNPVAIWRSPTSPVDPQFLHAATVDLGRLSTGPLTGTVLLRLVGGSADFDFSQFSFSVTERLPAGSGRAFTAPDITSVQVNPPASPTPEPATLMLMGTGLAAGFRHTRRRSRA